MGKTILVLGGGVGGLVTSNLLRKKLGKEHKITIVDKNPMHVFSPSFLWMMLSLRKPEKIQRGLSVLNKKNINFLNSEIKAIDVKKKCVKTDKETIAYDYLVISLGAELIPEAVKGLRESGYNLYDLNDVIKLENVVKEFSEGKVVILISKTPFKCPAAPYEAAFLLDYYFNKKGIRSKIGIEVYTPETLPMPVAGSDIGNSIKRMLLERNVTFNPEHNVASVNNRTVLFENGKSANFDLLIYVPPHVAPKVIRDSQLIDESGWISVDPKTLKTQFENVYAIGDIASIKLSDGKMLPKAGVFAHFEAEVIANNIAAEILGKHSLKEFDGKGYCFLELGYGKSGYASGNFYSSPRKIKMKKPGRIWHWGKILFEKHWMRKWF